MYRNFGIGIVILCFGLSSVNAALADQMVEVSPIIVQPNEVQALNDQMLNRDRQNRDEEIEIQKLIEENDKLTQATLARQQDEGLSKINQTMLSYRNALVSRDRARIAANGQKWWISRYGDLIALTEDADAMTVHQDLESKSGLLAQKFQMLNDLKDEMTALNNKLEGEGTAKLNQKDTIIEGYKKIAQQQQDKIQLLTQRLSDLDKRINHFDEIMAQKDEQIARLKDNLDKMQSEVAAKDEIIKDQKSQIDILQGQTKEISPASSNKVELPPVIVNTPNNQDQLARIQSEVAAKGVSSVSSPLADQLAQVQNEIIAKDKVIKMQQEQLDLLKSELENKITELNAQGLQQAENTLHSQVTDLQAQREGLEKQLTQQQDQIAKLKRASVYSKDQGTILDKIRDEVTSLKNQMRSQAIDLKAKEASIRWLNQVLAVTRDKGEYFKITAQKEHLSLRLIQQEVKEIKDDFTQRFKDYDQMENIAGSLKNQVNLLKAQLDTQGQIQQDLKTQLQDKQDQITKMKSNDNMKLAQQLIDLQEQETTLLDEKSKLALQQYDIFDRHFGVFENRMNVLLANRRLHDIDLRDQRDTLKDQLSQEQQEVESLKKQLEEKIANQKNQAQLQMQIQDLRAQLQGEVGQMTTLKTQIQSGQRTNEEADSLKQQLAALQDKADLLKQQLDSKIVQSDKMTSMMSDYQKKLESKDNAYNEELQQVLLSKNDQAQMNGQVADLNARLQNKEAQVIKIKKELYDLQELTSTKDRDLQTKDLNLSMIQQKVMDERINEYQAKVNSLQSARDAQVLEIKTLRTELALAREQLGGMPSSDEIEFLRTGLSKATAQLKQKDAMLSQIKANADEYEKEFTEQSKEFQSLKDQLLDAQQDLAHRNEDLKYKNMEIKRLKERSTMGHVALQKHTNKPEVLEAQLMDANEQIKNLRAQLNQFILPSKKDPLKEKLKQALDKIDQQGKIINLLAKKLQEAGQSVNLTRQ